MAKREAEDQLTKDNYEREDGDDEHPSEGFKLASETVLASRPMRGLPKRLGGASVSPIPAPQTNGTSETKPANPVFTGFGGFSGFGATATSSTSKFGASPATSSPFSGFGTTTGLGSGASAFSSTTTPLFGTTSSTTTTNNSSFSGFPSFSTASSSAPPPKDQNSPTVTANNDVLERYKKLRGLNHSLLEQLKSATEKDPFADLTKTLSTALDAYKQYREKIQSEDGGQDLLAASSSPKTLPSAPPPPPKPLSMPLPPAVPFTFGSSSSTSFGASSSTTTSSAAAPKPWTPLFPPLPTSNTNSTTEQKTNTEATTGGLTYPSLAELKKPVSSTSNSTESEAKKENGGALAPPPSSTAASTLPYSLNFGGSKPFGSSGFSTSGSGIPTGSSLFSFAPTTSTTSTSEASPPKTPNYFAKTPGTPVAFGSATPKTPGSGGFFGSAFAKTSPGSGSLGNPVGFSFGSPPKDKETAPPAAPPATSSTPNPFLAPPVQSSNATSREVSPLSTGTNDTAAEPPTDDRKPEDIEGVGEEDEIALCSIRSAVYVFKGKKWVGLGPAICKVKQNKETGKRRLLCRQEATSKVTVNFNIFKGFAPKADGAKMIAFTGHEEGEAVPFKLRCGDADKAGELLKVLEDAAADL